MADLVEVEPTFGETVETANYRRCDLCDLVPIFQSPAPKLYYDAAEGLYVCEKCRPDYVRQESLE